MNLVMLPMWIFSGVFFSSERFRPRAAGHPAPAAHRVNDALRAVMLEGSGLGGLSGELAILGGWMVLGFALALRLFRWR